MKKIWPVVIVLVYIACMSKDAKVKSPSQGQFFNQTTLFQDAKALSSSGKYSKFELKLLGEYIIQADVRNESLDGQKYIDLLNKAKNPKFIDPEFFQITEYDKKLNESIIPGSLLEYSKNKNDKYYKFEIEFYNNGKESIDSIKGRIQIPVWIRFAFITDVVIRFKDPIRSGEKKKGAFSLLCNPFEEYELNFEGNNTEVKWLWSTTQIYPAK